MYSHKKNSNKKKGGKLSNLEYTCKKVNFKLKKKDIEELRKKETDYNKYLQVQEFGVRHKGAEHLRSDCALLCNAMGYTFLYYIFIVSETVMNCLLLYRGML